MRRVRRRTGPPPAGPGRAISGPLRLLKTTCSPGEVWRNWERLGTVEVWCDRTRGTSGRCLFLALRELCRWPYAANCEVEVRFRFLRYGIDVPLVKPYSD